MTANPFIPGDLVNVTAYRADLEGTVMQIEGDWVHFRIDSHKTQEGAGEYFTGSTKTVHYGQVKKSERVVIRVHADVSVDLAEWAEEYGIPHTEVREDVKSYLSTQLSECSPLLRLKGFVS